jgi:hypothetical protein
MARILLLLAGVTSALAVGATAIAADRSATATLEGTSDGVTGFCSGTAFTVSGTYAGTGPTHRGTYSGTVTRQGACGTIGPGFTTQGPPTPVTAVFTFSGPGGSFTASGSGETLYSVGGAHGTLFPTTLTLTVTDGTKRFRNATGTLSLSITALYNGYDNSATSSGTLTGSIG